MKNENENKRNKSLSIKSDSQLKKIGLKDYKYWITQICNLKKIFRKFDRSQGNVFWLFSAETLQLSTINKNIIGVKVSV